MLPSCTTRRRTNEHGVVWRAVLTAPGQRAHAPRPSHPQAQRHSSPAAVPSEVRCPVVRPPPCRRRAVVQTLEFWSFVRSSFCEDLGSREIHQSDDSTSAWTKRQTVPGRSYRHSCSPSNIGLKPRSVGRTGSDRPTEVRPRSDRVVNEPCGFTPTIEHYRPNSGHGIAENQADRPTEVRIAPAARLRGG